jgi:hypothetical protein
MGLGTSIFLIALGAILRFAVTASVEGVNIQIIGTILMVVGVIGAVLSLIFWSSWGGFGGSRRSSRRVTRDDGGVVREDRYDDIDRAA